MLNRHINIGKIKIPLVAIILVAVLVVLLLVVLFFDRGGSDLTTDSFTPTPTPSSSGISDPTPTPVATPTPTDFNSPDTGYFNSYKSDLDDYLASLEASTGDVYANKQIGDTAVYRNNSIRKTLTVNSELGEIGFNLVTCDDYTQILSKNYTEEYFNDGYCYGMYFDDPNGVLAAGDYAINDNWFEHIIIEAVPDSTSKLIVFKCRVPMVFVAVAHNSHKQTVISAYERPLGDDTIVFIDPYYGGVNDQGGWRSNIAVSDLNLNIALRVDSLLKDHDCTVYLSRDRDECVGIWERVYLAEAVGADMYICLTYVNSQLDNTLKGIQTLYDTNEDSSTAQFNGKVLAQLLLNEITAGSGFQDNGMVSMGIAAYRNTSIPAAMAKLGYISNDDDFFQIIKEEVQYNTAVAVKDAIVAALELTK